MPYVAEPRGWWRFVEQRHDPVLVALVEHVVGGQHALPGSDTFALIDGYLHDPLLTR